MLRKLPTKRIISKPLVHLTLLLLISGIVYSQDASVYTPAAYSSQLSNYIRTWDVVKPETNAANITTSSGLQTAQMVTSYADGLGRIIQTTIKQGSLKTGSSAVDLVNPTVYDDYGRIQRQYQPFAASNYGGNTSISDGGFKMNPFQQQNDFYTNASSPITGQGDTYYYGKTEFEASPLNRVASKFAPGNSWVSGTGRGVEIKYRVNTALDSVRVWTVTNVAGTFGTYSSSSIYAAGELTKIISQDENDKQVIEFTDKQGNVILKKVQLTAVADDVTGSEHLRLALHLLSLRFIQSIKGRYSTERSGIIENVGLGAYYRNI